MLTATGRVLRMHWPALLAWFLGGMLLRHLLIELAGFVGGHTATVGLLILPLAVLARLIGFVGMFLVIRDGLRRMQAIAPLPPTPRERREDFVSALLASVLPFFAVYTLQNELRTDIVEYAQRALDVSIAQTVEASLAGDETAGDDTVLNLVFTPWTLLVIVVAIAGPWAWRRWGDRLPRILALAALYLEVVWVFFSLLLISQAVAVGVDWIETRTAVAWLTDARGWIAAQLGPLDGILRGGEALLADGGRVIVEPLVWFAIAGVIYGQTIAADRLRVQSRMLERAKAQAGRVPEAVRQRVDALTAEFRSRFRPVGAAFLLLWRSGPLVIGAYLLLYAIAKALETTLGLGLVRILGPHDGAFWSATSVVLGLVPLLLVEPIRVALIAGTYDSALQVVEPDAASDAVRDAGQVETDAAPSAVRGPAPDGGRDAAQDAVRAAEAAAAARADAFRGQGAIENLTKPGPSPYGATSIQNGPSTSSGTMNGTSIS